MTDERGQSLVLVALLLAVAAAAIVGLGEAQRRIVDVTKMDRAGEAAVEAAAAAVADDYTRRPSADAGAILADPRVLDLARSAANELAAANGAGAGAIDRVAVYCEGRRLEVALSLAGHQHRAGFDVAECSHH